MNGGVSSDFVGTGRKRFVNSGALFEVFFTEASS
jgi:hypothetical protein